MTALILPPAGGGGVTIYPSPSDLPAFAAVGEVVAVASDVTVRQWDGAAWRVVSSPSSPVAVADTNSVDLTVTTGTLTADVRLSASAVAGTYVQAALSTVSDGLLAGVLKSDIRGLLSVSASNTLNPTYNASTGVFSGSVRFSATTPTASYQTVEFFTDAGGIYAGLANSGIRSVLSWTDTNSVDGTYNSSTGAFSSDVRLSSDAADASNILGTLTIQSGASPGLRVQVPNASIRGLLSAVSPLSYNSTTGAVSVADQAANLVLAGPNTGAAAAPTFRALVVGDIPTGIAHSGLAGLTSGDDHTQYALLAGRTGGQTLIGGAAASNNLTLQSTSNATRGSVIVPDALRRSNNTTNASFVSGLAANSTFPTVTNLQSSTVTPETLSNSYAFLITLGTGESLLCHASFARAEISAVSDPSGLFLTSDAGTGIYVSKSTSSGVITFKNRTGGSVAIGVVFLSGQISASTAWA